jgi:cytochrome c biogenesis protein CcdA
MTLDMLTSLIPLALVDALNPFSIAALIYLLGLPRRVSHALVFTFGTFSIYLLGGVLLVVGISSFLSNWMLSVPSRWLAGSETAAGALCVLFAAYAWRSQSQGHDFKPPKDLKILTTLVLSMIATASDLPTAVPYFAAVSLIAGANASWSVQGLMLLIYCVIYITPLLFLVGLHAYFQERAAQMFARIQAGIGWAFAKLIPPMILIAGLWLMYDGIGRW